MEGVEKKPHSDREDDRGEVMKEPDEVAAMLRLEELGWGARPSPASVERRPNIDNMGLEALGVALDEKGMPEIDPTTLRIGIPARISGRGRQLSGRGRQRISSLAARGRR